MNPTPEYTNTSEAESLVEGSEPFELDIIDESPLTPFNPLFLDMFPFILEE